MAEKLNVETVNNSNKLLFLHKDGSPIIFFMRPCNERQVIRPIIEREGGRVTSKATSDCIKLAEKGSMVSREGYISTRFIEDCISNRQLQDIEQYEITPGTRACPDSDSEHSVYSFASNDSMNPAPYIVKTSSKSKNICRPYTREEDLLIIEYLVTENKYHYTNKISTWVELENLKIMDRSHDSLRSHYMRIMKTKLDSYKDAISPEWLNKLKGIPATSNQQNQEYSYDALFQQRPKKAQPDSTTEESTDKNNQGQKVKVKGQGGNVSDKSHKVQGHKVNDFNHKGQGDNGNNSESDKNKLAQKSITAYTKTREPLEFVIPNFAERAQGKINQKTDKERTAVSNHNQTENVNRNATNLGLKDVSRDRHTSDDNDFIPPPNYRGDCTVKTNLPDQQLKPKSDKQPQGDVAELLSDNDSEDEDDASTFCGVQSVRLSYEDGHSSKDDDSQETTQNKLTGISIPNLLADADSDFDVSLMAKSQKRKQTDSQEIEDNTSSKRKCQDDSLATNDSTLSPKDLEIPGVCLNSSDIVSTSSVEYDGKSHQLIEIPPIIADKCSEDSFDTMLRINVDVDKQGRRKDEDAHDASEQIKGLESSVTVSQKTTLMKETQQADNDSEDTDDVEDGDDGDTKDNDVDNDDDEALIAEAIDDSRRSNSTTIEERDLTDYVDKCRVIARVFGLSPEFVRQLLYRCSGDEKRVVAFIKFGPKSPVLLPWKSREDALVLRDKFDRRLVKKYGIEEINDRIQFLTYEL